MKTFKGIGSSDGIAIGSCYVLDRLQVSFQRKMIADCDVEYECSRLDKAVAAATEYIEEVRSLGRESMEEGHAVIFDVYIMLLRDDMLIGRSKKIIRDTLVNAEYALHTVGGEISRSFRRAEDEYLRERGNDIIHIVRKLMRFLTGEGYGFLDKVDENAIVISHDLSPSDTTHILQKNIKGISTELGSKVSHTSILARSLGLPAVVGIAEITKSVSTGDTIIIDGFEGIIIVNPDADTLEKYKHKEKRYRDYMSTLESLRDTEVKSADNVDVYLFSNIELNEEINLSNLNNASGIGLYRTEFIYLQHGDVWVVRNYRLICLTLKNRTLHWVSEL
jgi:phosphotransferase system enzyme I (PtsI)